MRWPISPGARFLFGKVGRVRRAGLLPDENAQSGRPRAGLFEILQFAHPHVGGELFALGAGALGVRRPGRVRTLDDVFREVQQVIFAQAVPPTVIRSILIVGIPTPTGTLWPSLPQTPMPSSSFRSLPTMLTYFNASGPLPIRVALRTGRVSLPSSIR